MARKQLSEQDIRDLFFQSDDEGDFAEEVNGSSSDSEDGDLPVNLVAIANPEPEGDGGRDELEAVSSTGWRAASNFSPPGPAVFFDSSHSCVQTPPASVSEASCFKLFLTEDLVRDIVEETNRYASQLQEQSAPGVGKLAKWLPTNIDEMYSFLMAMLLMGVVKKSSLREYWSTDPMLATPFFASLFSQDRFLLLLRCLHFQDNEMADASDPLNKIRNIFHGITSAFGRVFVPFKDLCIDKSLMLWKGRLRFRQFIPAKRHRFGVKFFVLCDVRTGYVQDMLIYTGSTTDIQHHDLLGISGSVVMTLLAPHLRKGHVLYVDNWYSSPTLFQHLLSLGTGACGTVRSNRKGMPPFTCKMRKGDVEFKENGQQLAVKWHDKRDVHVISTVHASGMAATGKVDRVTGEGIVKPCCVLDYNRKMGAVDKGDMLNSYVPCARKTTKWYKKVFFHLLDNAVLNGFIVHRQLSGKTIPYQEYRMNLIRQVLEVHHTARRPSAGGRPAADNPLRLTGRHFPSEIPQTDVQGNKTRRQCKVCKSSTRRSKQRQLTKYVCALQHPPVFCSVF
ncbi:piggyBac transposable element-derived protein 4-like [Hypomesus transpacificus]|uniref:piggyBac transposable element-derived protein 4-like n=1 Tax=Hypomesus transpacificus TaxID=137520 RepID=UPI001F071248|nr:piggyBac transposable element-derived protein 4-like [Hypomesus transpacificus]